MLQNLHPEPCLHTLIFTITRSQTYTNMERILQGTPIDPSPRFKNWQGFAAFASSASLSLFFLWWNKTHMWESPPVDSNMPLLKNRDILGPLWWSSGWDSALSAPRAQVQSLLRELRSLPLLGIFSLPQPQHTEVYSFMKIKFHCIGGLHLSPQIETVIFTPELLKYSIDFSFP